MEKNLLILRDSTYGTVAKKIALSMGCFEKIDVLNQRFGVPEVQGKVSRNQCWQIGRLRKVYRCI